MEVVICDTNIWYNIAQDVIPIEAIQDKALVGTFVTAHEFCTSFNIINHYELIRNAVTSFNQYTFGVIVETPLDYVKKVSGLEFTAYSGFWAFKNLEIIINNSSVDDVEAARRDLTQLSDKEDYQNAPFMQLYNDFRANIGKPGEYKRKLKEPQNRERHLEITKQVIQTLIPNRLIAWNNIELFLKTFDEWLFQLAINRSLRMTPNDWDDLFNLIYVKPGNRYWTFDGKKTKNFIRQCDCGHYLI